MTIRRDAASPLPPTLLQEVLDCGFYPDVVARSLAGAVGDRVVQHFLVHHEATFAGPEVSRHLTVLALLDEALIICHADEGGPGRAIVSSEVVRLSAVESVVLTQSVQDPTTSHSGLAEAWLTILWGNAKRIDVGPASCDDPNCEADHGYQGLVTGEDYVIRMSRDADGAEGTTKLVEFGTLLQGLVR